MEDQTTTDGASVDTGANEPQVINGIAVDDQGQALAVPEDTDSSAAAVDAPSEAQPSETTQQTEAATDTGAQEALPAATDEKLQKFAQSHGLELDSPNAIKAAKMAMDNQAEFHRSRQQKGELEQSMFAMSDESAQQQAQYTGENPEVLQRLQRMEVKESINDFWAANPDARQYEAQMTEIAQSAGLYGTPEAILKAAYAMAKAQDSDNLRSQGAQEALTSLAHKQQAAVPRGNAVNSNPVQSQAITPQNVDQLVGQNDLNWFMKNREAINKAMSGS